MRRGREQSAPHGDPPPLLGRSVLIAGPLRFQNLLLSEFLSARTGAACSLLPAGRPAPNGILPAGAEYLLLLDSREYVDRRVEFARAPRRPPGPGRVLQSLFNVPGNWGGESTALRSGVKGFFYEDDPPESLVKGIVRIFAGEVWVSRKALASALVASDEPAGARPQPPGLTPREREVLRLLAQGATNERIAEAMHISGHTVKTHVYNAYRKIGVENRVQAAHWTTKNILGTSSA